MHILRCYSNSDHFDMLFFVTENTVISYFENVQNALGIHNEELVTEDFRLFSNFPNPFNSSTNINYQILDQNHIRLNIFDTSGNAVIELVNEFQKAGIHSVPWKGTNEQGLNLPSGIYYCQIQVGDHLESNKMVLIK